jgi:hypothetical protein
MQDTMTPEQRLREVAEVLANAILRLRLRAALSDVVSECGEVPESSVNCLEVPSESRLSGPHGLTVIGDLTRD